MMYWEAAAVSRPANKLKSYWLLIFFTARMGERLRKLFLIYIYTKHKPLFHKNGC